MPVLLSLGMRDIVRNVTGHTDISTDREARLQSVLTDVSGLLQRVELRLALVGGILPSWPETSAEWTWQLLLGQTLTQATSLGKAIDLLMKSREDVVDLRNSR